MIMAARQRRCTAWRRAPGLCPMTASLLRPLALLAQRDASESGQPSGTPRRPPVRPAGPATAHPLTAKPLAIGAMMEAGALGRVTATQHPEFAAGTSALTRPLTIRPRMSLARRGSTRPAASTCSWTTPAARFSTRCSLGWRADRGSCSAAASRSMPRGRSAAPISAGLLLGSKTPSQLPRPDHLTFPSDFVRSSKLGGLRR